MIDIEKYKRALRAFENLDELLESDFKALANLEFSDKNAMKRLVYLIYEFANSRSENEFFQLLSEKE